MKAAVSVQVPGKVMLCGEYSVLSGGRALAATLDSHLVVRVRSKPGVGGALVASNLWDAPRFVPVYGTLDEEPLTEAVGYGLRLFALNDVEVRIDSELDIRLGFGSSSALRLGVLLALEEMTHLTQGIPPNRSKERLLATARHAYILQKKSQSQASGYDVATQLLGGLLEFEMGQDDGTWPLFAQPCDTKLQNNLPHLVHLFGGGMGAPTKQVLPSTLTWLEQNNKLGSLRVANETLGQLALQALERPDDEGARSDLIKAVQKQRLIFRDAPSYPISLSQTLENLPGCDETWTFKTTGAGGEDALLVMGSPKDVRSVESTLRQSGWHRLSVGFETAGARILRGEGPHA